MILFVFTEVGMLSGSMRTLLIVLGFQAVPYIGTSRNITDSRAGSKFKVAILSQSPFQKSVSPRLDSVLF